MPKVLLHIGYPKAGSNFLWQYFTSNPELSVETGSFIGNYLSTGEISAELTSKTEKHYILSIEQLSVWQGPIDIVGIRFKPYNIKEHQKKTCLQLHSIFPSAKVLIVTRGFESAFRSMYWQYISIGGILPFKEFQKQYSGFFADFYDYDYLIRIYREAFGSSVVLLPFELLQADSERFLRIVEEKCGLPCNEYNGPKANYSVLEKLESYRWLSCLVYKLIYPLPDTTKKKIYGIYSNALYQRKLSWLPNFFPETKLRVEEETLRMFSNKATVLVNEELFKPYLRAYSADSESPHQI